MGGEEEENRRRLKEERERERERDERREERDRLMVDAMAGGGREKWRMRVYRRGWGILVAGQEVLFLRV